MIRGAARARSKRGHPRPGDAGFTLTELVLVIVLVGILAAVAGPRFFQLRDFSERGFFDAALSGARFAQKLAVASGCNTRIQFSAGGFALNQANTCQGTAFTRDVARPTDGQPFVETAPTGIAVANAAVYFDAAGRPRDPATSLLLAADTDVAIGARVLRIARETGYTHPP